ncbi:MAG: lysozyme inhibitor LprI family protein [Candidatus Acidiferrales bacterium]
MRKCLALVLFVASSAFPSLAQNSQTLRTCNEKAKTQMEMNACASNELARVEAQMDDVYNTLLSKTESQPEALAKIKAAQKAWLVYRDAYIAAMYPAKNKQAEYGSMYPMKVSLLRAKLTQKQVAALKELLRKSTD